MDSLLSSPVLGDTALSAVLLCLFLYVARVAPALWGVRCWAWAQAAATLGADLMDLSADMATHQLSTDSVNVLVHLGAALGVLGTMGCAIAISMFVRQAAILRSERIALVAVVGVLGGVMLMLDSNRNDWTLYLCFQLLCLGSMPLRLRHLTASPYRAPALMMTVGCALLTLLYACELNFTWSSAPETWQASTLTLLHRDISVWFLLNFCMLLLASFKAMQLQQSLAELDPLTGALNRRGIERRMSDTASARAASPLCVLALDLDHFKRVNDTHGHDVGDRVLQDACQAIRACLRTEDLLVRLGGEEFAVLSHVSEAAALQMAERIRRQIETQPMAGHLKLRVTTSIGVGIGPSETSYHALIKQADLALYRAKQSGRNRVELQRLSGDAAAPLAGSLSPAPDGACPAA